MKRKIAGIAFVVLSIAILSVSAYVYEQASQTTTQTIQNVANLTLNSADLGPIEEGQTITYTPGNTSVLNDILTTDITKTNVILYFYTDLDLQTNYLDYQIDVIVDTSPGGSLSTGDTVVQLTMGTPDSAAITLDTIGTYVFDFQITTTAGSVDAELVKTVNIDVAAASA